MPRLALLSQSTPNHPRPPERRRRACNIVSFHNTDTLLSLVDLPSNVRKSSLLGICLDFRQFRANVTIAPARGVLAGSCPQRCPLFQWSDRLHAARPTLPTARERGLYPANPWHRTAIAGDSWQAFPGPRRIRIAWQDDPPQGRADGIVTSPSARCSRAREAAGRSNSPASEGPERCLLGNRYCSKHWGQRSGRQQRERLAVASRDGIAGVNLKA